MPWLPDRTDDLIVQLLPSTVVFSYCSVLAVEPTASFRPWTPRGSPRGKGLLFSPTLRVQTLESGRWLALEAGEQIDWSLQ